MIVWWAFVTYSYYKNPALRFDIPPLARFLFPRTEFSLDLVLGYLKLAVVFSWLVFLGLSLGHLLLSVLKISVENWLEWAGMSVGLGWGVLGLLFAGLGFLHLWSPFPVHLFLLLLTVILVIAAVRIKMGLGLPIVETGIQSQMEKVSRGLLSLLVVLSLVGALMPEISYDALVYHLALPELYLIKGRMFPIPNNLYAGFPQLMEMLYGLVLPFGDQACHLFHWGFGVLSAVLAYAFCLRLRRPGAGLMAAVLFYSSPIVGLLSCKAGVELGQAFFQLLAVYALAIGLNDEASARRWLVLSGISMGFALSIKYTAWPLAGIMALVVLFYSRAHEMRWESAMKNLASFVLPAGLIGGIWLLRNIAFYHNPVFPFFNELFNANGPQVSWKAMAAEGQSRRFLLTSWHGIEDLLLTPWIITTHDWDLDCLGPILVLGFPLLVLFRYRGRSLQLFIGLAMAFFGLLSLLTTLPRFFLPLVPFLAIAYALALEDGFQGFGKSVAKVFFFGIISINFLSTACFLGYYDAQDAIWGAESEATYLSHQHATYSAVYYFYCRTFEDRASVQRGGSRLNLRQ